MTSLHHEDDFLIAEYTLGLLDHEDTAQAHALLGADDDAVVCALQWEARLLELTDALTPLHPPESLLARIHATLGLPFDPNTLAQQKASSPAPRATQSGPTSSPSAPTPATPAVRPSPNASATQPGQAPEFEPRLIRPDTASAPQAMASAATSTPPAAAPPIRAEPSIHAAATPAQPAPRIRHAPPDPTEVFRREAASRRPGRKAVWQSLWVWRSLCAALLILAVVLALPKNTFKQVPARDATLEPVVAPAPKIVQVAVMQAPGLSSTPGWVLTVDSRQNVVLAPQVDVLIPESEAVYLWTYNEQSPHPRLLGVVDPARPLTLPIEVTGEVAPGQIFEMTQEPNVAPPQEPDGPILFIGRTVSVG